MAQTLVGDLEEFNLNDILQLLGMARQTGALQISRGKDKGAIYFKDGAIVHAKTPSNIGESAVYEFFQWNKGHFIFNRETTTDHTVRSSLQNIIMEAARRIDEWEQVQDLIPNLDVIIQFNPQPREGSSNISLKTQEWKVLSLVNGHNTVREIAQQSDYDEFETCKILYGLMSSGLLKIVEQEAVKPVQKDSDDHQAEEESSSKKPKAEQSTASLTGILKKFESVFSKGTSDNEDYHPTNPSGYIGLFINRLLEEYETPRELYGAIRLRGSLKAMLQKIADEYPVATEVPSSGDRINIMSLDTNYSLDNPQTFEVYQVLVELINQIFDDARKSLSPRSALLRYRQIFDSVFTGSSSLENLGLEGILDTKSELK